MYRYHDLLARLTASIPELYPHQVRDPDRWDHGAFIVGQPYGFAVADHCTHGVALARCCYALLLADSPLRDDAELRGRTLDALAFQRRAQRETGLIDLPKVDFDSPPDTAFMVQLLCPLHELATRLAATGDGIAATATAITHGLEAFLRPAALGLVDRGFRTPNHRWVVCSALCQAMRRFPDIDAHDYLERILAEGADINPDGEWSERSTGIYSAVCNRAWRFIAEDGDRPAALDPVRADLDFMAGLLNPDGTVVTSISLRQDGGATTVPVTMADSFFALGMDEQRADWLGIADRLVAAAIGHRQLDADALCWLLQPFAAHPEWIAAAQQVERSPAPDQIDRFHPASRFWRVGRGAMAATVCADNPNAFALSCGGVQLTALQIKGSFFNLADFRADRIERTATGVRLSHLASERETPGWDLPLGRRVAFDNPHHGYYQLAADGTRERWGITPIDIHLTVEEVPGGFDLHLGTGGGYDRIPFVVDLHLNAGTVLDVNRLMLRPKAGEAILMGGGRAVAHDHHHAIAIEGGGMAHRMLELMPRSARPGCYRLFMAFLSPLDERIAIRYGRWSEATRDLVPLEEPSGVQAALR